MTITGINVQIDTDVLQAVAYTANNAPSLMATAYKRQIKSLRGRVLKRLQTVPDDLPELPFIWSLNFSLNRRLRNQYIDKLRREGTYNPRGGRYQRTGKLAAAWKVITDASDYTGIFAFENDAEGADSVYGDNQYFSHMLTGWENVNDVAGVFQEQATKEVMDIWFTVVLPEG